MGLAGVLAASLSAFLIGGWYYSPAGFLNTWMREIEKSGKNVEEMKRKYQLPAAEGGHSSLVWVLALGASAIASYAMDGYLRSLGISNWLDGAKTGAWVGGAMVGSSFALNYAFGANTLGLLLLDGTYHVLQFALYGALLGGPMRNW